METQKLSDTLSIAGQITTDDLPLIHAMGFKTLICNRPDGESIDQTLFEAIEKAASNVGMAAHYIPVETAGPNSDDLMAFSDVMLHAEKPILAYCKSGGRSAALFSLSQGIAFPS